MENTELFTIWLTDNDWDGMPYLYELCIASWQVMNPNRKITIYTGSTAAITDTTLTISNAINGKFNVEKR